MLAATLLITVLGTHAESPCLLQTNQIVDPNGPILVTKGALVAPNRKTAAVVFSQGLLLVNPKSGRVKRAFQFGPNLSWIWRPGPTVFPIGFSSNSRYLGAECAESNFSRCGLVIDTLTGRVADLRGMDSSREIRGVWVTSDGGTAVTVSGTQIETQDQVRVWNVRLKKARSFITDNVLSAGLLPDDTRFFILRIGANGVAMDIRDVKSLRIISTANSWGEPSCLTSFSPDGKFYVVRSAGVVYLYRTYESKAVAAFSKPNIGFRWAGAGLLLTWERGKSMVNLKMGQAAWPPSKFQMVMDEFESAALDENHLTALKGQFVWDWQSHEPLGKWFPSLYAFMRHPTVKVQRINTK